MADPKDVALLPCPFCTDAAEIQTKDDYVFVDCVNPACGACVGPWYSSAEAAKKWNTRRALASPREEP